MPYTQMWEIQDNNGVIHSGTEEQMKKAFDAMTQSIPALQEYYNISKTEAEALSLEYSTPWDGDLKLAQIHETHR